MGRCNAEAATLLGQSAVPKFLEYCSTLNVFDHDTPPTVNVTLKSVTAAADRGGKVSTDNVRRILKLVDIHKTRREIVENGGNAIAAIMDPDGLKQCISVLGTTKWKDVAQNKKQEDEALTFLASMSYLSSSASEIVRAKALPMLCCAIKS